MITDADREKASKLWARCRDGSAPALVHEIAAALAEEREKARAAGYAQGRVEELELAAKVLAGRPPLIRAYSNSRKAIAQQMRERARSIRAVEVTE